MELTQTILTPTKMTNSVKLTLNYSLFMRKFCFNEDLYYFSTDDYKTMTIEFDSIFHMTQKMEALNEAQVAELKNWVKTEKANS